MILLSNSSSSSSLESTPRPRLSCSCLLLVLRVHWRTCDWKSVTTLCPWTYLCLSPAPHQELLEAGLFAPWTTVGTGLGPISFQEPCENVWAMDRKMIGFRIQHTIGINHFKCNYENSWHFKFTIIFYVGYGYNLIWFDVKRLLVSKNEGT